MKTSLVHNTRQALLALATCCIVAAFVPALACTPAAQQTATTVAAGVEAACLAVVSIEAPQDEPLCVLGDELAVAVIDYIAQHGGTPPAVVSSTATGRTMVPHDLYDALRRRPAVLARKVKAPVCKPAPGTVAP